MIEVRIPETAAQAFDLMAEKFGIGSYDELAASETPYYLTRNTEIAKIKAMMRKRRLSLHDVGVAIWYCGGAPVAITASYQVLQQVPEALRAYRAAERAADAAEALGQVDEVLAAAYAAGDHEFAARLMRADAEHQRALIREWREG